MQRELCFDYSIEEQGTWATPTELPNLKGCKTIALDTETYDPSLMEQGAGWAFGNGHIVGVSIAVEGKKWYFPIQCETVRKGFSIREVIDWVNNVFTDDVTMVGANLMYDLGWLTYHGAKLNCKTFDVQFAAPLLNEHLRTYSLESIAERYNIEGKDSGALYRWCSQRFGGKPNDRQRANIYRTPLSLVGPYAEQDAALPLEIMKYQLKELDQQDLMSVCEMENNLIHLLVAMRMRGVRVNTQARNKLSVIMLDRKEIATKIIEDVAGRSINVNAPTELANVFDSFGWEYPLTEKTKAPSFKVDFLKNHDSEFAKAVAEVKRINKLHGTFVEGYFNLAHKGRLHANLHPLRNDLYGTVSGRFACLPGYVEVDTFYGSTPMADIQIGDMVRSHKNIYREVLNKWFTGHKMVHRVTFTDGRIIDCTSNHRLKTTVGWATLEEDNLANQLFPDINGKESHIVSVRELRFMAVYDIEVEEDHSFIADGVIVHNCSTPNIQNIPSRDPTYGKLIRDLFIPEDGEDWASIDYSSIELRMLAHYAVGSGAEEVRKLYQDDPDTDFHKLVMDKTGLERAPAKTVSFSLCISGDQKVLTDSGLVPIKDVKTSHKVWDGVNYVAHEGVIYKGVKDVLEFDGLEATRDHKVWTEQEGLVTLEHAFNNNLRLTRTGNGCVPIKYTTPCTPKDAEYCLTTGIVSQERVYDILNAGPLHRFTVSNVLVSNCYGSGVKNTAELLGCTVDEAKVFREKHFAGVPFMKATLEECMFRAAKRGWIRTTKGRLARFTAYEPANYDLSQELGSFETKQECMDTIKDFTGMDNVHEGHIKRAKTYKALNSLLQGSAADLMKQAMVDIWKDGVLDTVGIPMLTVHDELNFSVARTKEAREGMLHVQHLMENAIQFRVPVRASLDYGKTWGDAH